MAVTVPSVVIGDDITKTWADAVVDAIAEIQALTKISGPAAIAMNDAYWRSWGGSESVGAAHADPQVMRFGRLVIMTGLAQNISGSAIAYTSSPANLIGVVPIGFRPRVVGSVAPLGGIIMTTQEASLTDPRNARIQISGNGNINFGAAPGGSGNTIANNGFLSLQAAWETEDD
jgi:hypothetical protein